LPSSTASRDWSLSRRKHHTLCHAPSPGHHSNDPGDLPEPRNRGSYMDSHFGLFPVVLVGAGLVIAELAHVETAEVDGAGMVR
jgi:hypothetical protein